MAFLNANADAQTAKALRIVEFAHAIFYAANAPQAPKIFNRFQDHLQSLLVVLRQYGFASLNLQRVAQQRRSS